MKTLAILAATVLALAACGGGGSDTSSSAPSADTATILGYLDATNVTNTSSPSNVQFSGVVKRWKLPIPVKTNGEARALPAMNAIEAKLGYVVFDRTSIANADEATIARGIVFRQGTSYLPAGANPQAYCANVSNAPYSGSSPANSVIAPGEMSTRLYVNLDNPQCIASADVTIHEIGHAMGLASHFKGFGDLSSISADFWTVLATLYGNPIGTLRASIVVTQIKN